MNVAAAFPHHDTMRDSGTEWLGHIPANWEIRKMKFLFRDYSRKGMPNAELLSVTQNQGVVPRTWVENRMVMPSGNLESFKFIEEGDFAISLRSFEGGLEYCHHDGIISPAYTVLKRRSEDLSPAYYRYLFKSAAFISELQTSTVGIREGKNISFEELSYSLMPIPGPDEQRAIAAFLVGKCGSIDEAVRIKEEQITLLRERRQILIQQAVTRGLNPDAPMKDSGIDWIGKIPAHWEVKPLTAEAKLKSVANRPELELLSVYLDRGVVKFSDVDEKRTNATSLDLSNYQHVLRGDLVLNNQQAWRGSVGVSFHEGIVSPAYIILKLSSRWDADFANLFFRSGPMVSQYLVASKGVGTIQRNLYWPKLKRANVTIPPIEEQRDITRHVQAQCEKIDAGIQTKDGQIATLKEYKTSLINAAVTGKIKVT
tara:strand:- start:3251 stop:4531 length:1281 start_codon:yes stop_codon:yes gene_type:complete